jgi:two-component system sensor histidine kinase/response regulator
MLHLDWHFIPVTDTLDPATAFPGSYNAGLVATSFVIAILAAFVALSISGRIVAATSRRARLAWASAGAISMGGGIWSMHFVGMLAFSLPCGVSYDPVGTVLSMIPGMIASGIALNAISKPTAPHVMRLLGSAVLMGAGIGAMHYAGMAAMQPEALLRYDPALVLLSVVVAIALAFASLSIRFRFRRGASSGIAATIIAATVMGCAVAGMHYTAMQASIFFPLPDGPIHSMALSPQLLAVLITIFTVLIATGTLVATFAGRQNELAVSLTAEMARRQRTEEDLVRAREQAEAANSAKSQFLATMSHEIRTPMNGVLGMANLLASTPLNERQRRLVENLLRSGQALLAIINDVLDFSKIEAGRFDLLEVDFDPREVIAEVTDLFCEPCARKGLEFVYFVAEDVPASLRGDPVRLRQVLINLVGNAIKFTERGEILTEVVIADRETERLLLSFTVTDTGVGIAPEQKSRVFESFHQADHGALAARAGSGLGLTIARHLVELMGGEIDVESELGRGSQFRFTARLAPSQRTTDAPPSERYIAQPLRVLLVDTNAVSARIMSLYLASWRLDAAVVAGADDAETAWRAARAVGRPYDVVIIDVKGLGAAGIALARQVRADEGGRPAEVIALVGVDSIAVDDDVEKVGAFAIMTKPARPSELFNCLASLAAGARHGDVVPFFMRRTSRTKRPQFDARILLVEDNMVNQEVAIGMLEAMGCRVVTRANGHEAVELFAREQFDLVLMDCEMPVMNGFEAARRIRELERLLGPANGGAADQPRTPIVAVTAHALTTVHEKCLQAGMDDFLIKPFDELRLAEALRRWLAARERPAVPSGAATPPPALDRAALDHIRALQGDGSAAVLRRVVAQFTLTAPPLAEAIRTKTGEGDAEAVWQAAHSLKSSAGAIGANLLARCCQKIEDSAREAGTASVVDLLDTLDAELAAVTESLKELT